MWRLPAEGSMISDDLTWWLAAVSLYFPIFYMAASWTVTIKLLKVRRA
jgi:hypothetical protein